MATQNLIKRLQNIMRRDAGISGDAQRIEQMVWLFFLKVYDAQETEWEYKAYKAKRKFVFIIPEKYRWRNWAHAKDAEGKDVGTALTAKNSSRSSTSFSPRSRASSSLRKRPCARRLSARCSPT